MDFSCIGWDVDWIKLTGICGYLRLTPRHFVVLQEFTFVTDRNVRYRQHKIAVG
jgi:hypothetical protein